jgi:TRAP transporter TAXI family solute receptor
LIAAVLTVLAVAVGLALVGPSPPARIVLATGQPRGVYDTVGAAYQERLQSGGLRVDVVRTNGSIDNIRRLLSGEVDIAFVQSGLARHVDDHQGRLRGVAALYHEPLWIFYRGAPLADSFAELDGRRISIGPAGSGTEALARQLLRHHGVDLPAAGVVNLGNADARRALEAGEIDVAFIVTSYRDAVVSALLRNPTVHLLGLRRHVAHARALPGLRGVSLAEGLLDLRENIPHAETTLLAPTALLVARADLHGHVVEQLLNVARAVHAPGSLIDPPLAFPSLEGMDFPVHADAASWFAHGESYLSRVLPYRAVRWLLVLKVLVFPALLVWLPLFRILPELNTMRMDRRVAHLYALLADAERAASQARSPDELRACLGTLDDLRGAMERLRKRLPGLRQRDLYEWRVHVAHVRQEMVGRLRRLEATSAPEPARIA